MRLFCCFRLAAAPIIQHAITGLDPREGDQLFREPGAPTPHEMLIGMGVGRGVARRHGGDLLQRDVYLRLYPGSRLCFNTVKTNWSPIFAVGAADELSQPCTL